MPLLERLRIKVYLPEPQTPEYEDLLQLLTNEFIYAFGGCSIVRGIEGSYLSVLGNRIPDRINLLYADAPIALSRLCLRSQKSLLDEVSTTCGSRWVNYGNAKLLLV